MQDSVLQGYLSDTISTYEHNKRQKLERPPAFGIESYQNFYPPLYITLPIECKMTTVRIQDVADNVTKEALVEAFESIRPSTWLPRPTNLMKPASAPCSLAAQAGAKVGTITLPSKAHLKEALKLSVNSWSVDDAFLGLTVLYDPTDGADLDICAIHGLGGHGFNTWFADERMWLRDLLPMEEGLQHSRIMTYGYNSNPVDRQATSGIRQWAIELLDQLNSMRQSREEKSRPIIFVSRSLGGLVAREAMIRLGLFPQHLPDLRLESFGILYLSTPHSGSSQADWNALLLAVAEATIGLRARDIISKLDIFNDHAVASKELFGNLQPVPPFRCLCEGKKTRVLGMFNRKVIYDSLKTPQRADPDQIVTQDSAGLNGITAYELTTADHRTICKHDRRCPAYVAICNQLKILKLLMEERGQATRRVHNDASLPPQTTNSNVTIFEVPFLPSDGYREPKDLVHRVNHELWANKTNRLGPQLLSVHGLAGIGKTQLALFYAFQNKLRYKVVLWFPSSAEDEIKTTCRGFSRGALQSVLPKNQSYDTSNEPSMKDVVSALEYVEGDWLMVFDNVERDQVTTIRGQFASASKGHVLLLSRQNLQLAARTADIMIGPLELTQAEALFLEYANLLHPTYEQRRVARGFARDLGGVPLALELAGSYLRNKPGYAADLLKHELNLRAISKAIQRSTPHDYLQDYRLGVFTGWESSFSDVQEKDPDAANLLLLFGMLDRSSLFRYQFRDFAINMRRIRKKHCNYENHASQAFSSHMFQTIDSLPDSDCWDFTRFEEATELITSYHLVRPNYDGSAIDIHPLVHAWASERLDQGCAKRWISWSSIAISFMGTALPIEWSDDIKSDFLSTNFHIVGLGDYANIDDPLKETLLRFLDFHCHWQGTGHSGDARLLGRWLYTVTNPKHIDLDKLIRPNDTTPLSRLQGQPLGRAQTLSGRSVYTGSLAPHDPVEGHYLQKLEALDQMLLSLLIYEEEVLNLAISVYQEDCLNRQDHHDVLQEALSAIASLSGVIEKAHIERKQRYRINVEGKSFIVSRLQYRPDEDSIGLNELRKAGLMDTVSKDRTLLVEKVEASLVAKFKIGWPEIKSCTEGLWMLVGALFEIHRRMLHLQMQRRLAESYDEDGNAISIVIGLGGD